MIPVARFGATTVLAVLLLSTSCSKKGPECQKLINSMNELGTKLADTQKVTGNEEARPEQVAAALRPFAQAARHTSESLSKSDITVPELKRIASSASAASLALASSSSSMADAAEQMKGLDTATKAAEQHKKIVDDAEAEIRKICSTQAALCTELAKVLASFPVPPDRSDDAAQTATWTTRLAGWTRELANVPIKDEGLRVQLATFEKGWKDFASVLSTLVQISETAKKYDGYTKSFNAQIDAANKAISEANAFCRT